MIEAMIFDLDGTLVQTEKLKALSYARAAIELCPRELEQEQVMMAFKEVVGLPRREVAMQLVQRFDLEAKASGRMAEFGVSEPWQAYVQVRLRHYEGMLDDPQLVSQHRCAENLEVLDFAREQGYRTGLATMSRCRQAQRVLDVLELRQSFDFIATRDDVNYGKPDPEIYALVAEALEQPPQHCLVLEDSASGVESALEAGAWCIAATNEFSQRGVHQLQRLEPRWIVDNGAPVLPVVKQMLAERANG